jgi:hypothetical protein
MQLTIPTFAAATFALTFAFAPAIANVASHFGSDRTPAPEVSAPVKQGTPCQTPVAKVIAALSHKNCA